MISSGGDSKNQEINEILLKKFKSLLVYWDIRYFTLKYLKNDFFTENKPNEIILTNLISLFSLMPGLAKGQQAAPNDRKVGENIDEMTPPQQIDVNESDEKELKGKKSATIKNNSKLSNDNDDEIKLVDTNEDFLDDMHNMDEQKLENGKNKSSNDEKLTSVNLFCLKLESLTKNGSKIVDQDSHRKLYNDALVMLLKYPVKKLTEIYYTIIEYRFIFASFLFYNLKTTPNFS